MKKTKFLLLILAFTLVSIESKGQLLNDAKKLLGQSSGDLSEKDAADGIREALIKGTGNGVKTVSKTDGYYKNPEIKIPFPPEEKEIESEAQVNRAWE